MRKKIKATSIIVLVLFILPTGLFLWRAHMDRRSVPGRIVRWLQGESGIDQDLNDTADDIRCTPLLSQLQPWATETLKRFREGKMQTNGYAAFYWDQPPAVKLARQEKPEFIRQKWGETNEFSEEEPEVFVVCDTNGQPQAVAVGWYMYGIRLGPADYQMDYPSSNIAPYFQVKPGVYVYGNYK